MSSANDPITQRAAAETKVKAPPPPPRKQRRKERGGRIAAPTRADQKPRQTQRGHSSLMHQVDKVVGYAEGYKAGYAEAYMRVLSDLTSEVAIQRTAAQIVAQFQDRKEQAAYINRLAANALRPVNPEQFAAGLNRALEEHLERAAQAMAQGKTEMPVDGPDA